VTHTDEKLFGLFFEVEDPEFVRGRNTVTTYPATGRSTPSVIIEGRMRLKSLTLKNLSRQGSQR
jgi:hypothetical protein